MLQRASSVLSTTTLLEADENEDSIGFYMKSGFCYSDVKCFIPMVVSMALIAIWFSDKTSNYLDKESMEKRKQLISSIEDLPRRIHYNLGENDLKIYKKIAETLKNQTDIFILAKGTGFFAANYTAQKFLQISGIHAEAYPSGEFRHGPLSMIDEKAQTPVFFILLDDEHMDQIIANIMQIKSRGATTVILSNLENVMAHIDVEKHIDFLIHLDPNAGTLAALQAIPPLQMISYYTALARGLNPDQ